MNKDELYALIRAKYKNISNFCIEIDMIERKFYDKVRKDGKFTRKELIVIKQALHLNNDEFCKIFME